MPSHAQPPEAGKGRLARLSRAALTRTITHVVSGVAVLILDLVTGPFLMFPIFFVVPVAFAAWFCSRRLAMVLGVALPAGRACIAAFYGFPHPLPFVMANAAVRTVVLLLIAYLVSRTAAQTRELDRRVKMLEGLLPICSYCKRIRDEHQNWRQLESYISQHSEAHFTHTFCPECVREHYGDLLDDEQKA